MVKTNDTIPKTIEHWFIKGKKHVKLPKAVKLLFIKKKIPMEIYQNNFMFLNKYIALELWFTMEKLWYYRKNYGTMGKKKPMVIWKKSNNTMKKLWYYTENYGTLLCYQKTMVL